VPQPAALPRTGTALRWPCSPPWALPLWHGGSTTHRSYRLTLRAGPLVRTLPLLPAIEPTGNLDRAASDGVFVLMRRMRAELNTSFLLATHDPRLAARCERTVELVDGRIERDEMVDATSPNPHSA